jgi:hypothetical protein
MRSGVDAGCFMRLRLLQGLRLCVVLVEGGAASHACCCRDGWAPIHWAAGGGHSSTVELLIANDADVNARDK